MGSTVVKKSSQSVVPPRSSPVEAAANKHLSVITAKSDRPLEEAASRGTFTGATPSQPFEEGTSPPSSALPDAGSVSSTNSGGSGQATRGEIITRCLRSLEGGFGVNFEREELLNNTREVHCRPGKILLVSGQSAVGVFIVEEGGLEVFSPQEDAVLWRLQPGDFCGELSSFFHIPCTATIRAQPGVSTTLLLLPLEVLSQSSHEEEVPMYRMLQWCAKRSYIGTATMFDKLDPSLLIQTQISNCLKSPKSVFYKWSNEARNEIATKSSPMLFSSGDILYEAGEDQAFLFLILRGSVEFSDGTGATAVKELVVRSSSQGGCIGGEWLLGSRMTHTVTATSPLLAVPLTMQFLKNIENQFPSNTAK